MEGFLKNFAYLIFAPLALSALPKEGKVAAGNVNFSQPDPHTLVITASDKAIINYEQFSIGENEAVQFIQPKIHSTVLNRVTGGNPSEIFGHLRSNGRVFLINPNGILYGPNSQVNVGSLIASTLNIDDNDFLKEKYRFRLDPRAKNSKIVNRGTLTAMHEGHIVLMAPQVFNEGVISAHAGKVALLAGETVTIDFSGDGLISFAVEGPLETAIIEHFGKISAPQGEVLIRLKTADHLVKTVVNVEGLIVGNTIEKENGIVRIVSKSQTEANHVTLMGHNVEVSGDIVARDTLHIEANDVVRMRNGKHVGDLSMFGRTIAIGAPIDCSTLTMKASEGFRVGADIKTRNSPIEFNAPVIFTATDISLSTGSIGGNIIFNGPLDSDARNMLVNLTLASGSGDILFKAPLGGISKLNMITIANAGNVVASSSVRAAGWIQSAGTGATTFEGSLELDGTTGLYLNCHVVNLNDDVTIKGGGGVTVINSGPFKVAEKLNMKLDGPFHQKGRGEVIFGGNISSSGNITFMGSLLLIETIELNAAAGNADIVFNGNVEGPGGLKTTSANLIFSGDLGHGSPLSALTAVSSSSITVGNIGGLKPGVTGKIDLTARDAIHFRGTIIHANAQKYLASQQFNMISGKPTSFLSSYSNAPIVFQNGHIHLSSGTDLSITTTNGDIIVETVRGTSIQNLTFNADNGNVFVGAIGSGEEVDCLSITGKDLSLRGPVKARRMELNPKSNLYVRGDLTSTFGDLVFSGPVILETAKLQISAGEKGDIVFLNSLNGKGEVLLSAPGGTVRFDGPIGDVLPFSSLTVGGKVIDQNNSVNVTGPIVYSGETRLGGKINTKANAITFNGPVIRDNADTCGVSTLIFDNNEGKTKGGNIIFTSTLDADKPDRKLSLTAADAIVSFKDAIGKKGMLGGLSITAKDVHLEDVGNEQVSGCRSFHIEAKKEIYFRGKIIHAGEQKWAANNFNVDFKGTAQFVSDSKPIEFNRGAVSLSEGSHLAVNTQGGHFGLIALTAPNGENVSITAGNGDVLIGEVTGNVGVLAISGRSVSIADGMKASTIRIQAEESIVNFVDERLLSASGDVYLNARNGKIGLLENPLWVETLGQIHLGSTDIAYVTGSSADGIVHSIPANRPPSMVFNGIEYYDLVFDEPFSQNEEYISLTPDLFTTVPTGYADAGIIKPRKASLYYQLTHSP